MLAVAIVGPIRLRDGIYQRDIASSFVAVYENNFGFVIVPLRQHLSAPQTAAFGTCTSIACNSSVCLIRCCATAYPFAG